MYMQRYLRWFSKKDTSLQGEVPFSCPPLEELQSLFAVDTTNPMVDCWAVTAVHKQRMEEVAGVSILLEKFDYFIEVDEV